jgi:alanyl-tRNA synthetase
MNSSEIRSRFIQYFEKNGHTAVKSSSLIPENDPTLMFANAGMNQFKNTFLGLENRPYKRAVSSQKCVRAGGKHNDLENVGFTARHHTFFEMLGNFSFGDYFKKDAIHFAWELLTKELGIPKEKLYVTVFETDDEAADIWHKQEGVPRERIFRFGEKDNFWRMGDTGPCGPCSEIFYDHGPKAGRETDPFKGIAAGEDRFVEIWNLVFMQFYESAPGKMEPLPKPSVDTGSGLERVTAALQGKLNNYDTDLFWPMITRAAEISGKTSLLAEIEKSNRDGIHAQISTENVKLIAALRVVADHVRSASFLIADGALPSNEGRGYVLRRILRRAIRFSQMLSGGSPFLPQISEVLISQMSGIYPELKERRDIILNTLKDEQDRFMTTLGTGTTILNQELSKLRTQNKKEVSGDVVFKLYDTYGFPADLTRLMAEEQGFTIDEKKFESEMEAAREKAKASWKGKGIAGDQAHLIQLANEAQSAHRATQFTGYTTTLDQGKILYLSDGSQKVNSLKAGQSGLAILDRTPFYAEGGGQAGDLGTMKTDKAVLRIADTTKQGEIFLHHLQVESGEVSVGETVHAEVFSSERRNTTGNHSATHLLHSALRKVLGTHVTQAGQLVDSTRIRFDFTHGKALSPQELENIEQLVNNEISKAVPVTATLMAHKEAINSGAMALFGEKYGDEVRVLKMGDFSTELCGGTHVTNTSQIRVFKIVSESGVSAGVRRIEALSGDTAIKYMMSGLQDSLDGRRTAGLDIGWEKISAHEAGSLSEFIEKKKDEIKALEKEIKKIQGGSINIDELAQKAQSFQSKAGTSKIAFADLALDDREVLAQVTDHLKNKIQSGVVIVVGQGSSTHPMIVSVSKDLNPEISAGNLLKELAQVMGGKGGGRPDFAQGAVPDRSKLSAAFTKAEELVGVRRT